MKIIVFISGAGSNLLSIIKHLGTNYISAVISDNRYALGLKIAKKYNITSYIYDRKLYTSKNIFERDMMTCIDHEKPDYLILAGFMSILSYSFIKKYKNKIINIHPSLLPKYKGLNTYKRALDNKEKEHGVTIHIVTAEIDNGPILLQESYLIDPKDTIYTLKMKGKKLEHILYPKLLKQLI